GDTIAQIAAEKAGVFRRNAPAVIGPQSPEAMAALRECASATGAPLFAYGEDWNVFEEHGRLIYQDEQGLCDLDPPKLFGAHQVQNAGLAVAAVRAAQLDCADEILSAGVSSAAHPARLQRLTAGPMVELARRLLDAEPEIWLDGGHNPHAGRAVARAMADLEARASKPLVMIAGMQANKDATGYFRSFKGLAARVFAVAAKTNGVASAEEVASAARAAGLESHACVSIEQAMRLACDGQKEEPPRLLVSGSLYLAGEVLKDNR
ncbi:MAG: glutamate ligase domain-containing protein, partial [Hyphococcus sp.]